MNWFTYFLEWYSENPCLGLPILFIVFIVAVMVLEFLSLPVRAIYKDDIEIISKTDDRSED